MVDSYRVEVVLVRRELDASVLNALRPILCVHDGAVAAVAQHDD